jgi:hypothetical protein
VMMFIPWRENTIPIRRRMTPTTISANFREFVERIQ